MAESLFGNLESAPDDPILSLNESFKADSRTGTVNLTIGVYTDEQGRIPVLPSVAAAYERMRAMERPYLPMEGHGAYRKALQKVVFGTGHPAIADKRIATIQTIGGTGAIGIAADFLASRGRARTVYISDPSWENHHALFQRAGFRTASYPYWDSADRSLDFQGMLKALEAAEAGSIVVLHAVCHNPTGIDLDAEQQSAVTDLLIAKRHIAVFDMAYQGFGTGLDQDAGFVRAFAERAQGCIVANSFSKNFSLYGERCGGLSVVCGDQDEAGRALGQLKVAVRRSYSSPPTTGSLLIATVLDDEKLRAQWALDVAGMRARIGDMRALLAEQIRSLSNEIDASFLHTQRGMFSYTGLSKQQVRAMRERHGVYLVESGRMCIAGLTPANIPKVAASFADVARGGSQPVSA